MELALELGSRLFCLLAALCIAFVNPGLSLREFLAWNSRRVSGFGTSFGGPLSPRDGFLTLLVRGIGHGFCLTVIREYPLIWKCFLLPLLIYMGSAGWLGMGLVLPGCCGLRRFGCRLEFCVVEGFGFRLGWFGILNILSQLAKPPQLKLQAPSPKPQASKSPKQSSKLNQNPPSPINPKANTNQLT